MEVMSIPPNGNSPYKNAPDSPSRQLLWELSQMAISSQQRFYAQLDTETEQQANEHRHALAVAAAKHDHVLKSAELERQKLDAQIQAERERREIETKKEIERQRREKAEREIEEKRRELERVKALEQEQKRLAELEKTRREASEAAQKREEQERADTVRREQEQQDAERRKREEAQNQPPPPAQASSMTRASKVAAPASLNTAPATAQAHSSTAPSRHPEWEAEYNRYLEIHKQLKQLRKFMNEQARNNPQLKTAMGDMRREMRKCVGQLTEAKGSNKRPLDQIKALLRTAKTFRAQPSVPIPPFLASPPPISNPSDPSSISGPGLLIYILSIFSKAIIGQYINEAAVSPQIADPIGIIASQIFSSPDFLWQNTSLISILLAKFHVVCPVIFGIYGPENTVRGKERLGWWREESRTEGNFVSTQRHFERMMGLGAGFASISLRNFEKSKNANPVPNGKYWEALAKIADTPSEQLTQTHFVVLKAMVQGHVESFVRFYGGAAVAALRLCLLGLPERAPEGIRVTAAVRGCTVLVDTIRKDKKLAL